MGGGGGSLPHRVKALVCGSDIPGNIQSGQDNIDRNSGEGTIRGAGKISAVGGEGDKEIACDAGDDRKGPRFPELLVRQFNNDLKKW